MLSYLYGVLRECSCVVVFSVLLFDLFGMLFCILCVCLFSVLVCLLCCLVSSFECCVLDGWEE